MVQFITFYKDLGLDANGYTVTIFVTFAEDILPGDEDIYPTVSEFSRISAQCDFQFIQSPGFKNYIGSISSYNAGGKIDENMRIQHDFVSGTDNVIVLQVSSKDNYRDIYGVCTSKKFRGIGQSGQKQVLKYRTAAGKEVDASFTQTLFNFIIQVILYQSAPNTVLSLGVDFTNPYFESAVKVYLKAGFGFPKISRNLNIRGNVLPIPFLKLEALEGHLDTEKREVDDNFRKSLILKKSYFDKYIGNMIEIKISKELNNYMTHLLTLNYETGVSLALMHNYENVYSLVYPCILERKSAEGNFTAEIARGSISFHTHPLAAMVAYHNALESWPSCTDMINQFSIEIIDLFYYKRPLLTIVATHRGYYTSQKSQFYYDLINKSFVLISDKIIATKGFGKFILNFMHVYSKYVAIERLPPIATRFSRYIFMSRMNQISLSDMFRYYAELIDRVLEIHDNYPDLFSFLISSFSSPSQYTSVFPNFFAFNNELDIVRLLTFNNDTDKAYEFLVECKRRGYQEFIVPLIQECAINGVDLYEPLHIATHVDDFMVNPDVDSASFFFYNYDNTRPNPLGIRTLQEFATREGILDALKASSDTYVNPYPLPPDTTIHNIEKYPGSKNVLSCDPSFYFQPENAGFLPGIV